jgi:hypothetical protein
LVDNTLSSLVPLILGEFIEEINNEYQAKRRFIVKQEGERMANQLIKDKEKEANQKRNLALKEATSKLSIDNNSIRKRL